MKISEAKDAVVRAAIAVVEGRAGAPAKLHDALSQLSVATPDVVAIDPKSSATCTCGWVGPEEKWIYHALFRGSSHSKHGKQIDELNPNAAFRKSVRDAVEGVRAYVDKRLDEIKAIPGKDYRFLSEQMLELNRRLGITEKKVSDMSAHAEIQGSVNNLRGRVSREEVHPARERWQIEILRLLQDRLPTGPDSAGVMREIENLIQQVRDRQ